MMEKQMLLIHSTNDDYATIIEAANLANVSQATIRNWIKAGHIEQVARGLVTKASLHIFQEREIGRKRLIARANKSSKDTHDHDAISSTIIKKISSDCFDSETISEEYENSLSNSFRNKEGIYYTPTSIVENLFSIPNQDISNATFCDPCCGSGNFLIQAIKLGCKPENVYGFDTDANAVAITKKRIFNLTGINSKNIQHEDFLLKITHSNIQPFDFVFTNPPWGKKLPKDKKEYYGTKLGAKRSLDTSALFSLACLKITKKNGMVGLLLPDSFFNIATFEDVRIRLASLHILRIIDFGKPFKGLMTKAIGIALRNDPADKSASGVFCEHQNISYQRTIDSFISNPKTIFNFWCLPQDAEVIAQSFAIPHVTLAGQSDWGLGIVTGNNDNFCHSQPDKNRIPVFRGSDITNGGLSSPNCYISSDLSLYQQVAPRSFYEAKEKLIYKFISTKLCFFHDTNQRYVLNSANILIPHKSIGITAKQLCDLFNSDFMNWLFSKLFMTHKVLRGDLEQLPIHIDYFKYNNEFDENTYLDFILLERDLNGTYRTKRKDNRIV